MLVNTRAAFIATAFAAIAASAVHAEKFDIPGGDLASAVDAFTTQSGITLVVSSAEIRGLKTAGVKGDLSPTIALEKMLRGTGFVSSRDSAGVLEIVRQKAENESFAQKQLAVASAPAISGASLETVTVTSSKIGGDVQNIPIAITAMSQEQLTATQTAGGPDLVKQVPNLTFSKTNFTGYNIQIRGIGTQAISVTTDPAVAVAFNDIPFIRNHFFEQEFYDVSQVEVLRGPQGTLYGRNATAGVVNLVSAKPTDQYEAMASVDVGNYNNRRFEGMLNIPLVGDKLDLRIAGEWTKRDGYAFDEETGQSIDGRDLWSGRVSVLIHPVENLTANLVWEHFNENDDRARSTKQLCTRDNGPAEVDGPFGPIAPSEDNGGTHFLTQGCLPGPLYGPTAFETPNANAIPFVVASRAIGFLIGSYSNRNTDPYLGITQSQDLRVIDSLIEPRYRANNDTLEFNADFNVTSALTLTSQTGYNNDSLYSTEDYNRFNTNPDFLTDLSKLVLNPTDHTLVGQDNEYCDPQLGCSSRMVGEDVSRERAWQFSQEFRLASNYSGPFNFSVGVNYLHYQTVEDYFVFFNLLSLETQHINGTPFGGGSPLPLDAPHIPFDGANANSCNPQPASLTLVGTSPLLGLGCAYIDPHPLSQIDGNGHNYFRSENPYHLNSWAGFGEIYYQVEPDVKLTGGLRWTDDRKAFDEIPSWAFVVGEGYPILGVLNQQWQELTGRFNATWTPKLDFTDQSLFYGSYAHGYKGGGANPPGVIPLNTFGLNYNSPSNATHPLTFKPEFIDAFELGTKNTLLDGAMTLNADVFFYDYKNYQISQIVDRTSVNLNFNATVKGAEIESTWEPLPGLRFNLGGGYQDGVLANGSQAIDLMDRTAGHKDWLVFKPFFTQTSNCILPTYVANAFMAEPLPGGGAYTACLKAYTNGVDPVTFEPYVLNPDPINLPGYIGFNPATIPAAANDGEGFAKNLSGNQLPNAPHFTLSFGSQYSMPVSADWAATLRGDFYLQSDSFARVFNDRPYDQLHGYTNVNLALIFTNQDGWQAMAYMKNVFNTTAITGAFLNSDDTALTTNVFVTDPRLFGLRITKNW